MLDWNVFDIYLMLVCVFIFSLEAVETKCFNLDSNFQCRLKPNCELILVLTGENSAN